VSNEVPFCMSGPPVSLLLKAGQQEHMPLGCMLARTEAGRICKTLNLAQLVASSLLEIITLVLYVGSSKSAESGSPT